MPFMESFENEGIHEPPAGWVGDGSTAGVMKDTFNIQRFTTVETDFTADDPGPPTH
jgi:hypothetical protein